ncbi:tRNA pseudouridine(38-40) synthase TruA [Candidimonas humi]|uniref:tRNA pseudouridine synthase A n=1 Tax=Candidimonas humi TaxID=683355 RepID=A0ABV8NV34_9BURK|nr:tRNA pseudouridine(38-40) synthase TruA [Candidimonas humi]MBV6303294.1 tRNA pseudouridine(38-40) synthase TruA [Candidimonas humi]
MTRMALGVSYDGASWHGWQTQPGGQTVQDALEAALSEFLAEPASTICAGRTDTGVHALGQVVHLDTVAQRRDESWVRGLNALLPSSIAVQWAQVVPDDFHARFSALSRSYIYILRNARVRSPLAHGRVGWVARPLAMEPMAQAAAHLLGEHDFSSFRSSQCQAASPVRTLHALDIERRGDYFIFTLRANAFLHHMVRNLIGALVYIGLGRQPADWMLDLLAQKDRRLAAPTFAPDGLYFAQVEYPARHGLPASSAQDALARIPAW